MQHASCQEQLTEGLAKVQVVLARQLANQAPSQLPLQRLTSEQMQQLQLQVQQDRQRQVSWHLFPVIAATYEPPSMCIHTCVVPLQSSGIITTCPAQSVGNNMSQLLMQ